MARTVLKLRRKRLIKPVDLDRRAAEDDLSLDELIASKFQEVIDQADQLEDPGLRDMWLDAVNTFVTDGNAQGLIDVCKWRRMPVDLDEFVYGEAYLHQKRGEIFPSVIDALYDLDTDAFDQAVLMGSLGCGKTTLANLSTIRDIYKVSCMRSPHATYGIQSGTQIGFTIQSIRLGTAKKVVFDELGRYIRDSAYFKTRFPYDPNVTTELRFRQFNMKVTPVSSSTTAVISMNVLGGQLDEMNFMQKIMRSKSQYADEEGSFDQAKQMFNTLANRRKSRFINRGNLPGILFVISSSRFPDDFTEQQALLSEMRGGTDPKIYVYHHSRWSAAPEQFSEETFRVQIGDHTFPSRVIKEGEEADSDCRTIEVPVDFKEDFERDPDGSLRDLAGVTTLSTHPFITQRQYIKKAMDNATAAGYLPILPQEQYDISVGLPVPIQSLVRNDIDSPRHCHIDLGISKDACGLAIGHIAGHRVKKTKDKITGVETTEILPVIAYDLVVRITPPRGGEIQIADIRRFLIRLKVRCRIPIKWVTMDGFQSVDSRQILRKKGFLADYLSVEKIEPYNALKTALYGERILIPYNHFAMKEMADLELIVKNNNEKVDHRPNGTKDVSDAVAGVAHFLLSRKMAWREVNYLGGEEGLFLYGDDRVREMMAKHPYSAGTTAHGSNSGTGERKVMTRRVIERRQPARV